MQKIHICGKLQQETSEFSLLLNQLYNIFKIKLPWLYTCKYIHSLKSPQAGRNNLLALVKELLLNKNVPHSLVEPLLKIHRSVQTNPQQRIHDITEIIAELRYS